MTAGIVGVLRQLVAARDRRRWLVACILAGRLALPVGTVVGVALTAAGVGVAAGWVLVAGVAACVVGDVLAGVDARLLRRRASLDRGTVGDENAVALLAADPPLGLENERRSPE